MRDGTKTVTARIPEDVHVEIIDRCNREGCTVNFFLNKAIEFIINHEVDFNFGDIEDDEEPAPQTPKLNTEKPVVPGKVRSD